jgi:hypothetical protein
MNQGGPSDTRGTGLSGHLPQYPFAPERSVRESFEGPGRIGSVKSPMQPIRRSSATAGRSRKQV